jgi:ribosomal protein S27E
VGTADDDFGRGCGDPRAGAGDSSAASSAGSSVDGSGNSSTDSALFRARCPDCGYLKVPASALRLVLGLRPFYSFRCPGCGTTVRRPAGERVVELLTSRGVLTLRVHAS